MLCNPNWTMDAAHKLGLDPDFALLPYRYWLARRGGHSAGCAALDIRGAVRSARMQRRYLTRCPQATANLLSTAARQKFTGNGPLLCTENQALAEENKFILAGQSVSLVHGKLSMHTLGSFAGAGERL